MKKGFTLIEMVVAVGILALIASVVVIQAGKPREIARDNKRKADLQAVQAALEVYFATNRSYPSTVGGVGCFPWPDAGASWCGEPSGYGSRCYADGCTPNPYIPGLAPAFITVLPSDPTRGRASAYARTSGCSNADAGYVYISNGIDYKMISQCTLERAPVAGDSFIDPRRSPPFGAGYWAWAVYSPGARSW